MTTTERAGEDRFRVWVTACNLGWPSDPHHRPATAVALEPAEEGTMSAQQAAVYVEAFNRAALAAARRIRAVALPVTVRYEGDLRPGDTVRIEDPAGESASAPSAHDKSPPHAR
ncbi:MAG: hypothetical protein A2V70_01495 [Planctomycetes bacterium RBG_13_63_9]|nr:MAG: hypothetical protein A2V70_01495 [Planctomycetes bacterium RBG_13_63_9]